MKKDCSEELERLGLKFVVLFLILPEIVSMFTNDYTAVAFMMLEIFILLFIGFFKSLIKGCLSEDE